MPRRLIRRIGIEPPRPIKEEPEVPPLGLSPAPLEDIEEIRYVSSRDRMLSLGCAQMIGYEGLRDSFRSLNSGFRSLGQVVARTYPRMADMALLYGMSAARVNRIQTGRPHREIVVGVDYAGVEARLAYFEECTLPGLLHRPEPPPRRDARIEAILAKTPVRCTSGLDNDIRRHQPVAVNKEPLDIAERIAAQVEQRDQQLLIASIARRGRPV